ncbi:MAG: TolC family protein [Candidatus Neomarinimicrobiota bacterium]
MFFSNHTVSPGSKFSSYLLAFLTFLTGGALLGQPVYTLSDCIRVALENQPGIRIARLRVQSSLAGVKGSLANILPTVSYRAGYLNQGSYVNPEIAFTVPESEYYSGGISLNQTIYDGGRWWNQIAAANTLYEYTNISKTQTRITVILEVKKAFYQYLKNLQLLEVSRQSVELAKHQLELVKHQYEVEAVARTDLLKQRVQLGNMEVDALNQEAATTNSFNELANAMGLEVGTEFSVLDNPEVNPVPMESFPVVWKKVTETNPSLLAQQMQVDNSALALKIARSGYFPTLSLSVGYDGSSTAFDQLYTDVDKHWRLQTRLSVSYPLFTGFSRSTQVEGSRLEYKIERENQRTLLRNLQVQLDFTMRQLSNLDKMIPIFEETRQSAEEDQRLARERYNLGAATILDVLDAQLSVARANSSLVRAIYDRKILQAQLDALLGKSG